MTTIAPVHPDDLRYEISLARKLYEAVGFLPYEAIEHYAMLGGVLRAHENQEPCGFLVFTRSRKETPRIAQIYQAAIQMDAQRRHHGLALVEAAAAQARQAGAHRLQCWCACDLEANEFWAAAGFFNRGERKGGAKRKRKHFLWQRPLIEPLPPEPAKIVAAAAQGSRQIELFDHRPLFR